MKNKITAIIIDDETLARELIKKFISYHSNIEVISECSNGFDAIKRINEKKPDLIFLDIQMPKINGFEMLELLEDPPVIIFTTAYDQYALQAFKVNSIDYLLKPIDETELTSSIQKFKLGFSKPIGMENDSIAKTLQMLSNTYKARFLVKVGEHLRMIPVDEIAVFIIMEKSTFLRTYNGRDYGIDFTLEQIVGLVDPKKFFRVNRKFIVDIKSIQDIIAYSNSRLKLKLAIATDEEVIVSRERVGEFKEWLEK